MDQPISRCSIPAFDSPALLRSGHAQTLAGLFFPGKLPAYRGTRHFVQLRDGDTIVLHDDEPNSWHKFGTVALLMHGLAGSNESSYMIRVASKLNDIGVRTFRMDLRGCGAGAVLARLPYHAGRSQDVVQVVDFMTKLCPDSPVSLIGFSLSGNILLRMLGKSPADVAPAVVSAIAINPPIKLLDCSRKMRSSLSRFYDRRFAQLLFDHVNSLSNLPRPIQHGAPQSISEFDATYTVPVCGFLDLDDYYRQASSFHHIPQIQIPTLILSSANDPIVPVHMFESLHVPQTVKLHITNGGGHLGYIACQGDDPDRHWMDWRIVDWIRSLGFDRGPSPLA